MVARENHFLCCGLAPQAKGYKQLINDWNYSQCIREGSVFPKYIFFLDCPSTEVEISLQMCIITSIVLLKLLSLNLRLSFWCDSVEGFVIGSYWEHSRSCLSCIRPVSIEQIRYTRSSKELVVRPFH